MKKSEVRNRRSEIGGIVFFLIAVLCPLTSLFAQATYVPRSIKDLDDARGVTLSLKFTPMWDGTKFTPRFILQSDVTDLVSDLAGKVPTSRTVNGHALSSDVTIAYGDLDGPFPTFPASMGATASNFFTSYNSASGLFTKAQPVFSDLSGTPTTLAGYGITDGVANSRTVNGHPLSSDVTVAYSELGGPFPTFPANTGATANQFFTAYADTTGLFTKAQPSIANLSDAGTLATWAGITPGTGVGTALGVNIGSAGAPILFNGTGGTPTSMTGTNITGTAAGLTAGNVTTNANLTGHVTSTGNAAVLGSFTTSALNTALSDNDVATLVGTETLSAKTLTAPIVAILKPVSDSTTAVKVTKSNGSTAVTTWDTINGFVGVGVTPSTILHIAGTQPAFRITDTDGGTASFYSHYGAGGFDVAQLAVNRNPSTGVFVNGSKAAAQISLFSDTSANGGSTIQLRTSTTNNADPANGIYIKGSGAVGINVSSPNANAILDVTSTTKAVMLPRMTTTQKNAIASPTEGMMVYDTTLHKLSVYTGVAWETVTSL